MFPRIPLPYPVEEREFTSRELLPTPVSNTAAIHGTQKAADERTLTRNPIRNVSSFDPLRKLDSFLPLIQQCIVESKSNVPKELLAKISLHSKLLFFEISAVRIQAMVRRKLAQWRMERMRNRLGMFLRITQDCSARFLEEVVLAAAFELSLSFYRSHNRFKRMKASVEVEIEKCKDRILVEVLDELCQQVTRETVTEAVNVVVELRYVLYPTY
jgi:hypothetical protein